MSTNSFARKYVIDYLSECNFTAIKIGINALKFSHPV